MKKFIFLLLSGTLITGLKAQNPATVFTIPNRNINLACGTPCTSFSAQVPHIKQTADYVLTRPAYLPFPYTTPTGNELTSIYSDDVFSSLINLAFPFCFYGSVYNSVVVGSNAIITFDATNAGSANSWPLTTNGGSGTPVPIPYAGGTQNSSFSTYYPKASIMGPYNDIYPTTNGSGQRKIEWRIEGTAPKRRFIASFNSVPMFSCTTTYSTSQIVIYEGTGVVEVYIHDKPICSTWNQGLAILGIQNFNRDKAVAAPGKNATVWGGLNIDSCYRFIPSAGASSLKAAELVVNGTVVANADTSTLSPGVLNLNFPNVCPTADSTAYVIRVTYGNCSTPAQDVIFTDTVFVKRPSPPAFTAVKTDASCTNTGSIVVTGSGGQTPYEYSINNGTTWQTSGNYTGLAAGTYNVRIRTAGSSCIATAQTVTVAFNNNLTMNTPTGGSVCRGASFTPNITSNATTYSWSPTTGVSNPAIANPTLTPDVTTTYTVTGTLGTCTVQRTFTVNVFPGVTVNAGPDAIILTGDVYPMQGTGSAGTYLWTPSTGLSATNILNPNATPTTTTTYTLRITNAQGCFATDDVTLTVIPYCVKVMEAFTPNGDGINDRWLVTNGNCVTNIKASVFNRYGSKVFESNDYKNNWDGTYSGKPLPDGTYYYVISYMLLNGKMVIMKGNLTILR